MGIKIYGKMENLKNDNGANREVQFLIINYFNKKFYGFSDE